MLMRVLFTHPHTRPRPPAHPHPPVTWVPRAVVSSPPPVESGCEQFACFFLYFSACVCLCALALLLCVCDAACVKGWRHSAAADRLIAVPPAAETGSRRIINGILQRNFSTSFVGTCSHAPSIVMLIVFGCVCACVCAHFGAYHTRALNVMKLQFVSCCLVCSPLVRDFGYFLFSCVFLFK